ncbi:unnamed protein product [Paramecium sonneborni]|uniref:Transmembrane protein n=1 Tax=Paramecium sonneborni TaxID=65129 RepID=A0A8S1M778_9CILI|nr:unnamed protein product [Paramecium sonneborni]
MASLSQNYQTKHIIVQAQEKITQRVQQMNNEDQTQYIQIQIKNMNLLELKFINLLFFRFLNILLIVDYQFFQNRERIFLYKDYFEFIKLFQQLITQIIEFLIDFLSKSECFSKNFQVFQLNFRYFLEKGQNKEKYFRRLQFNIISQTNRLQKEYHYNKLQHMRAREEIIIGLQFNIIIVLLQRNDISDQCFVNLISDLDKVIQQNSFESTIQFLLKINGNLDQRDYLKGPYQNLLQNLFYIQNFHTSYNINHSLVKYFERPDNFFQVLNDQYIVFKTQRKQNQQEIVQLEINREIDFQKKFHKCIYLANGLAYLRVFKQTFFFMRKYYCNLSKKI